MATTRHEEALRPRLVPGERLEPLAEPLDPLAGLRREPDPVTRPRLRPGRPLSGGGARQIDLVVDDNPGEPVREPVQDPAVRLLEAAAVVHHREHRVGFLHRRPGPLDADPLHGIVGRMKAGGIDDPQGQPVHLNRLLHGIPGRARHLGHDRPLPSDQPVQQARLADVRTPHDDHPEPFAEQVAPGGGSARGRHRPADPVEPFREQALGQVRDLLVRKVESPLDEGPDLDELRDRRVDLLGECAVQRTPGQPGRLVGGRVDEVRDRLGLNEIELAVEERAFGELARSRRTGAEGEDPARYPVEDHRPAVTLKLQGVLAGVGVRGRKPESEPGVEGLSVVREKPGRGGDPGLRQPARHRPGHLSGARAAHPHDPDPAPARRGGDGGDGVRHACITHASCVRRAFFTRASPGRHSEDRDQIHGAARGSGPRPQVALPPSIRLVMTHCWAMDSRLLTNQ